MIYYNTHYVLQQAHVRSMFPLPRSILVTKTCLQYDHQWSSNTYKTSNIDIDTCTSDDIS